MRFDDVPIRQKLTAIILLTSGLAVLLACAGFLAYEAVTFRQAAVRELATLGRVIAANSTAALAFQNQDDAREILAALRTEPNVEAAALYDRAGRLFAHYPAGVPADSAPADSVSAGPSADGYRFTRSSLAGFVPVVEGKNGRLGTLYIRSNLRAMYERLWLYGAIVVAVIGLSLAVAYAVSRKLQQQVSLPILALAATAKAVSDRHDYSVRAPALGRDELGSLTDAFNQMLQRIEEQRAEREHAERRVFAQLARHTLLNQITRAIGERQGLTNIFAAVVGSLEDHLPIDFGCICLYDPPAASLVVMGVGVRGQPLAAALGMTERARIPIDPNGLTRCIGGDLVYEPNVHDVPFAFPQRLAAHGLGAVVIAPLLLESRVFGALIAARREADSFSSLDCEFLRQLSEHVALATQQAQLYDALQQAYDDLRQSQQAILQQERLRALGEMASGIAHDINNAISPIGLYSQLLLESEPNLSPHAREYLETIERAIDDVAATVGRMREFYRQREPEVELAPADMNTLVHQVLQLTRARWNDIPQQRGVMVEVRTDLALDLPPVMVAESEIREALTNLVFNAVDAMPDGGTLVLRTTVVDDRSSSRQTTTTRRVVVEVVDSGTGMDEETRRRCLEPFYTTKGERGTGLGLAMVYGVVQRHGADIELESTLDEGTTVRLSFLAPVITADSTQPAGPAVIPSRLRLLIVDDDPMLLKSLRDTLELDGHVCTVANGGQEGIDLFRQAHDRRAPFSVVITDLGMPYVDGRQVASAVKHLSPTTPVLLLTGWGRRMRAEGDTPPHVDCLLSKPPKLSDLRSALGSCCQPAAPAVTVAAST